MKLPIHSILSALAAATLLTFSARAENLGEIIEEGGLGAIIGTWVDADTNGETVAITYAWRIENHALSVSVNSPNGKSEGLIGVDPKSGKVLHVSLDDKGGASSGQWTDEDGVATLNVTNVDADGTAKKIRITHKIRDNKELVVGMSDPETGEGGEITLVRKAE